MQKAVSIVENLSEVQSVSLLKQISRNLFAAVPHEHVEAALPSGMAALDTLRNLPGGTRKQNLESDDSATATRLLLTAFAQEDALAPVLLQAWDEIKSDDSLFIETIIAVGLMANLTLFMASSEIEFSIGGLTVKKGRANPEVVKSILDLATALITKLPPM